MNPTNDKTNYKILEKRAGALAERAASPRVSVVIPAYNCSEFIEETLRSVLAQKFTDYEIILVNDGSPDTEDLERALAPVADKIIYIRQKNGGTAAARNTGIEEARGELLAFLDADDVWLPAYLAAQVKRIDAKNCDMVYADAELFGARRDDSKTYMEKSPSVGAVTTESLITGACNVITSGTVVRRARVRQAGLFDEDLPRIGMEDFDLWFRLAKGKARIFYQKEVLLKYRVSSKSLSGGAVERAERDVTALKILREKYELDEVETSALEKQLAFAQAELSVERGKYDLTRGNFEDARREFGKANEHHRKFKFTLLNLLLKTNPKLIVKCFKKMRPAEFSFVAPVEKNGERVS